MTPLHVQLRDVGDISKQESTTQEVERILEILGKEFDNGNRTPVCFFEFVINPESFGQTIENIFYASFLVRVS